MKKCLPFLSLFMAFAFQANAQTITVNTTGFISNFGITYASAPLTSIYSVTADSLTDSLTINLAAGSAFSIGTGSIGFTNSFRLGGVISSEDVFVKFEPTTVGIYEDTIYMSSPGATTQIIVIKGECVSRPEISFDRDSVLVTETAGTFQIALKIANANVNPTSVKVELLSGGTAVPDVDFNVLVNGDTSNINPVFETTFPSNSTTDRPFTIQIINNKLPQPARRIKFVLTNLTNGAVTGSKDTFELIILDDDFRKVTICDLKGQNAQGVPDSLENLYEVRGVAYGINVRTNTMPGYQFTLIDSAGCGIAIYNANAFPAYTVRQGDSMVVRGRLTQQNGLRQLYMIDTIGLFALFRPLKAPTVITKPSEAGESDLVRVNNVMMADTSGNWSYGTHKAYVVGIPDTFMINIANELNNLVGQPKPKEKFYIIGLGGQYDTTLPYTSGYQIFPRNKTDVVLPVDSLSKFALTTPIDSATFTIQGLPTQLLSFNWTTSVPMNGVAPPLYMFLLDQTGANFTTPRFSNASANGGTSNNYSWSYNSIVGFLTNEGVVVGQTVTYKWSVRAQSGSYSRLANQSHVISFLRETMASSQGVTKEMVMVYPNPASDELYMLVEVPISELYLTTLEGKRVEIPLTYVNATTVIINVQNLAAGLYHLQLVSSAGELFHSKFIKK